MATNSAALLIRGKRSLSLRLGTLVPLAAADLRTLLRNRGLFLERLHALLLSLQAVDRFHQLLLRLMTSTLHLEVQLVVQRPVDLLSLPVLLQHAAQNAHAADPEHLLRQASVAGSLSLSGSGVAALGLRLVAFVHASTRVHDVRLSDDQTILQMGNETQTTVNSKMKRCVSERTCNDRDGLVRRRTHLHQLADVLARVRRADFRRLVWVHPNLALAALHHRSRQPASNHIPLPRQQQQHTDCATQDAKQFPYL